MFCTECGVRNPDGSKFCRDCGLKIAQMEEPAIVPTQRPSQALNIEKSSISESDSARLSRLLDMAFWHSESGHLPSAVAACEAALKIDPSSSSALSLLGLIYEKQGKIDKAINVFEKIVAINPGSVADVEKLDHLRRGIYDKAVQAPLFQQFLPPAFVQATRRYPKWPIVSAVAVCVIMLLIGFTGLYNAARNAAPPAVEQPAPDSSVASPQPRPSQLPANLPVVQPSASQVTAGVPPPVQSGYAPQNPGTLDQIVASQDQSRYRKDERTDGAREGMSAPTPSISQLQPLTVPQSALPSHTVNVAVPAQPIAQHVVNVQPQSAPATAAADNLNSVQTDSDTPDEPESHIFVNVQGAGTTDSGSGSSLSGATPLPPDSGTHAITLKEDVGASLQQKGLNLQQEGNYKAAQAAYQTAIAAFLQDIANGRNVDEARRGIDACQVAIQICKQSQ